MMDVESRVDALRNFIAAHPRLFVLTGAGLSHGSGIPTYRDHDARWQRSAPITHQEFTSNAAARKRYWARSMAGWPLIGRAQPNAAHRALAALQAEGRVRSLITQNVDGLHQRAGSRDVIELHGNVGEVRCLDCGARVSRAKVQEVLIALNPDRAPDCADGAGGVGGGGTDRENFAHNQRIAPDGDADINDPTDDFVIPPCPSCGGTLKPDVVFFGANVPRERVDRAFAALDDADAILVVGSSLMVYSGFRFCERAAQSGKPIASVNQGRTRADHLYALKIEDDCTEVLPAVVGVELMVQQGTGIRPNSAR